MSEMKDLQKVINEAFDVIKEFAKYHRDVEVAYSMIDDYTIRVVVRTYSGKEVMIFRAKELILSKLYKAHVLAILNDMYYKIIKPGRRLR